MVAFLQSSDAAHIAQKTARNTRRESIIAAIRLSLGIGLLFSAVYLGISGPAQLERLQFSLQNALSDINAVPEDQPIEIPNNSLVIPRLNLSAPILWEVPLRDSLNGLQRGVVHAQETALPGQQGRTFIVGHSAGYWWNQNQWTKVFSLLEKLEIGDRIYLSRDEELFTYEMKTSLTVAPSEVNVLTDGPTEANELALMTCTPVGTTLRRLIVLAQPVAQ